jgi:hypothetical protein
MLAAHRNSACQRTVAKGGQDGTQESNMEEGGKDGQVYPLPGSGGAKNFLRAATAGTRKVLEPHFCRFERGRGAPGGAVRRRP